ncbi:MAG: hypothetical protein R3283_11265, partial [Balneolaceae bacterium]|nr:hypothetical protein [Balneolaceae bacterium]
MDKKIEKKTWTPKRWLILLTAVAILSFGIYAIYFMDVRSSQNVDRDRLILSTVSEDVFQEYIQVTGTVQPIETIYLDAIEGGVVQRVYRESGSSVEQGDTILTLANSGLQLQVMQQTSGLYDQINNVRNSRLNLEQNTLQLQEQLANAQSQMEILERQYRRQQMLMEQNLTSQEEFENTRSNYEYQKRRYELTRESYRKDSIQAITQERQLNESEERMYQNLNAVQQIL